MARILDQTMIVGNASLANAHYFAGNDQKKSMFTFSVACTPSHFDKETNQWVDDITHWYNVIAFGMLADNLHASLANGTQVIVIGYNRSRTYQDKNTGENRTSTELIADYAGVSLAFVTAQLHKTNASGASKPPVAGGNMIDAQVPQSSAAPEVGLTNDASNFDSLFSNNG